MLNNSNSSYGRLWTKPNGSTTVEVVFLSLVLFFSLLGNILVLVLVYRSRRVHWSTNMFVAHLAIVNLLFTGISVPMYIFGSIRGYWLFGIAACKLAYFSNFLNAGISGAMLSFMALDRYCVILHPLNLHMTREEVYKALALVWFVAAALSSPNFYFCQTDESNYGSLCFGSVSYISAWRMYLCIYFLIAVLAPLILIVVLNMKIFWTIYKRNGELGKSMVTNKLETSKENNYPKSLGPVPETKKKTAKMLLLQNIFYALSWLPYFIYLLLMLRNDFSYPVYITVTCISSSNASVNPIIYWCCNGNFRRGTKHFLNVNIASPYSISQRVYPKISSEIVMKDFISAPGRRLSMKLFRATPINDTDNTNIPQAW